MTSKLLNHEGLKYFQKKNLLIFTKPSSDILRKAFWYIKNRASIFFTLDIWRAVSADDVIDSRCPFSADVIFRSRTE